MAAGAGGNPRASYNVSSYAPRDFGGKSGFFALPAFLPNKRLTLPVRKARLAPDIHGLGPLA